MEIVSQIFVGVDVSKSWFDAYVEGRSARFTQSQDGYSRFVDWVGACVYTVVLEPTGGYERALRVHLDSLGIPVIVADCVKVKSLGMALGKMHKTDRIDARMLSVYGACCGGEPRRLEREKVQELRRLVSTWNDLRKELRSIDSRLKAPDLPSSALRGLEAARVGLDMAVLDTWCAILELISSDSELSESKRLLETITGVGESAAVQILAQLPSGRLRSARALARFAGLAPCHLESGSSVRGRSRIPNRCNGRLRTLLYLCSLSASRFCPHLNGFKESLILRGKAKKQALMAVARKLAHAIFAVLTTRQPYDGGKLIQQALTN